MDNRKDTLAAQLEEQINTLSLLIEQVIHLDHMKIAHQKAMKRLDKVTIARQTFYEQDKIPDIIFLNQTLQGKEIQKNIASITHDITNISNNIKQLTADHDKRMGPFNDLKRLVKTKNSHFTQQTINALLKQAKVLNPEGSLADKIKMIADIIKQIFTLHCAEIRGICYAQKKRNDVRTSIMSIFSKNHLRETPSNSATASLSLKK